VRLSIDVQNIFSSDRRHLGWTVLPDTVRLVAHDPPRTVFPASSIPFCSRPPRPLAALFHALGHATRARLPPGALDIVSPIAGSALVIWSFTNAARREAQELGRTMFARSRRDFCHLERLQFLPVACWRRAIGPTQPAVIIDAPCPIFSVHRRHAAGIAVSLRLVLSETGSCGSQHRYRPVRHSHSFQPPMACRHPHRHQHGDAECPAACHDRGRDARCRSGRVGAAGLRPCSPAFAKGGREAAATRKIRLETFKA
jgi:hypothetical protein